jgi:acyl CoA:acetate/3-ketoacid CoA transferase alpha subunit
MNASETQGSLRRRIRNGALGLGFLALAFYFGFIVLLVHHSHH